jgi:hypothetical protein
MKLKAMKSFVFFCSHFLKKWAISGNTSGNISPGTDEQRGDVPTSVPTPLTKWEQSSPCATRVVPVVPSVLTEKDI